MGGPYRLGVLAGTSIDGADWLAHPGSVGRVPPGHSLKVLDEAGVCCAPGRIGKIYFLPDSACGATYRYLGTEARTNGEYETSGDLGHLDRTAGSTSPIVASI